MDREEWVAAHPAFLDVVETALTDPMVEMDTISREVNGDLSLDYHQTIREMHDILGEGPLRILLNDIGLFTLTIGSWALRSGVMGMMSPEENRSAAFFAFVLEMSACNIYPSDPKGYVRGHVENIEVSEDYRAAVRYYLEPWFAMEYNAVIH